jgi:hypothetical protein
MNAITTWTTRDGKTIPITEMADSHLANAVRMLRRKLTPGRMEAVRMVFMLATSAWPRPNGEMASEAWDEERINAADSDDPEVLEYVIRTAWPLYDALRSECDRRGLEVA